MGIISSKKEEECYVDSYHITDTFCHHQQWKHTMKQINHQIEPCIKKWVNLPDVFGSQPYHIYAVYDKDLKRRIQEIAYDQPHIHSCNYIFIFCARTNFHLVTDFPAPLHEKPSIRSYFYKLWDSYQPNVLTWSTRQTYIAIGFVIAACSEESIPCYPVDSFQVSELSSLLDLPSHLIPTAILTIGAED
jgi:nitroreductase